METQLNCSRLTYQKPNFSTPCVVLGIVEETRDGLIKFKTARGVYWIPQKSIVTLEPTNVPFREVRN